MRSKFKLRLIELIIILLIAIVAIISNPPFQLLPIPFLIIISMRSIMIKLEDALK